MLEASPAKGPSPERNDLEADHVDLRAAGMDNAKLYSGYLRPGAPVDLTGRRCTKLTL